MKNPNDYQEIQRQKELGRQGKKTGHSANTEGYEEYLEKKRKQEAEAKAFRDSMNVSQPKPQTKSPQARSKPNKSRSQSGQDSGSFSWGGFFMIMLLGIFVFSTQNNNSGSTLSAPLGRQQTTPTVKDYSSVKKEEVIAKKPQKEYFNSFLEKELSLVNTDQLKDSLRLRLDPIIQNNPSNVITKIPQYEIVEVLSTLSNIENIEGKDGSWVKVRFGNIQGYVFGGYLLDLDFEASYVKVFGIGSSSLPVYAEMEKGFDNEILSVPNNTILKILAISQEAEIIDGVEGRWAHIDWRGITGYVLEEKLVPLGSIFANE
jgi:hypothetical protein